MRRTNTFRLAPNEREEAELSKLCDLSAVLWNLISFRRRQSFFKGKIDWDTDGEYKEFGCRKCKTTMDLDIAEEVYLTQLLKTPIRLSEVKVKSRLF